MDRKIEHIGELSGKVLMFGGVYSNLQALEKLISIAKEEDIVPRNCICTGDIVGYCAQPEETVDTFREWGARSIAGNVELQLAEGARDCGCEFTLGSRCDGFSKLWYPYAQERLSKSSINWMAQLPSHIQFDYAGKSATVVHGSFYNVSEFIFKSTPQHIKKENLDAVKSEVIIAGHSGLPFHQEVGKGLWLNPGVIGMPANDGTARVWCVILDEVGGGIRYSFKSFEYDNMLAHQLMQEHHLPQEYGNTLISGIWDNMEILPVTEKKEQGVPLCFDDTSLKVLENTRKNQYKST